MMVRHLVKSLTVLGLPDFFTNEIQDPNHIPDTIYTSDGAVIAPVKQVLDNVTVTGDYTTGIVLSFVPIDDGWIFIWEDDPAPEGAFLTGVTRSDGQSIQIGTDLGFVCINLSFLACLSCSTIYSGMNAWRTNRVRHVQGQPDIVLAKQNILDYNSTGSYTLTYGGVLQVYSI